MRTVFAYAALASAMACAAPPPAALAVEHGRVRARTAAEAERVAEALEFAPDVRDVLGATRSERPELWVVEHDLRGTRAICYERRIELRVGFVDYDVVHELVHWYMRGSAFDGVPHFVEEGLCDYVALDLLGHVEWREREQDAIGQLTVPVAALQVDSTGWFELPRKTQEDLTRLGFAVVRRLGLLRVRALVDSDATPWDYMEAAGIWAGPGTGSGPRRSPNEAWFGREPGLRLVRAGF